MLICPFPENRPPGQIMPRPHDHRYYCELSSVFDVILVFRVSSKLVGKQFLQIPVLLPDCLQSSCLLLDKTKVPEPKIANCAIH